MRLFVLLLVFFLLSCDKREPLTIDQPFLSHDILRGTWQITEWNTSRRLWRYMIFSPDSTVHIILHGYDPRVRPFIKDYSIRLRDSVVVDREHPFGNGIMKVLESDGYKMTCTIGSWEWKMQKLNTD